jgi:hypothetical protein
MEEGPNESACVQNTLNCRLLQFDLMPEMRTADAVAGQIARRIDQIMAEDGPLRPIYEEFEVASRQDAENVVSRFPTFSPNLLVVYTGSRRCSIALVFNLHKQ